MVERTTSAGSRKTAFYFARPPPLAVLGGPGGAAGRVRRVQAKRKARRDQRRVLGIMNREKRSRR